MEAPPSPANPADGQREPEDTSRRTGLIWDQVNALADKEAAQRASVPPSPSPMTRDERRSYDAEMVGRKVQLTPAPAPATPRRAPKRDPRRDAFGAGAGLPTGDLD